MVTIKIENGTDPIRQYLPYFRKFSQVFPPDGHSGTFLNILHEVLSQYGIT